MENSIHFAFECDKETTARILGLGHKCQTYPRRIYTGFPDDPSLVVEARGRSVRLKACLQSTKKVSLNVCLESKRTVCAAMIDWTSDAIDTRDARVTDVLLTHGALLRFVEPRVDVDTRISGDANENASSHNTHSYAIASVSPTTDADMRAILDTLKTVRYETSSMSTAMDQARAFLRSIS